MTTTDRYHIVWDAYRNEYTVRHVNLFGGRSPHEARYADFDKLDDSDVAALLLVVMDEIAGYAAACSAIRQGWFPSRGPIRVRLGW